MLAVVVSCRRCRHLIVVVVVVVTLVNRATLIAQQRRNEHNDDVGAQRSRQRATTARAYETCVMTTNTRQIDVVDAILER